MGNKDSKKKQTNGDTPPSTRHKFQRLFKSRKADETIEAPNSPIIPQAPENGTFKGPSQEPKPQEPMTPSSPIVDYYPVHPPGAPSFPPPQNGATSSQRFPPHSDSNARNAFVPPPPNTHFEAPTTPTPFSTSSTATLTASSSQPVTPAHLTEPSTPIPIPIPPLTLIHYACYHHHRSMLVSHNVFAPVGCMTCGQEDTEPRRRDLRDFIERLKKVEGTKGQRRIGSSEIPAVEMEESSGT
ncbi:MAG: hypothetical protein M1827_000993 [Pycnora praestabilis]|nr:MAG: hypothetical protein M1827_000993 [Pycnora praestabilis]